MMKVHFLNKEGAEHVDLALTALKCSQVPPAEVIPVKEPDAGPCHLVAFFPEHYILGEHLVRAAVV